MSEKRSIFFDEWQACLRAHYKFVIQDGDTITEPTLRIVLLQSGLNEDDLHALADEARAERPAQVEVAQAKIIPEPSDDDDDYDDDDDDYDDPDDDQMALF